MKYALIILMIVALLWMVYEGIKEEQESKRRKYKRKKNRYLSLLVLLLPFSAIAQSDTSFRKQPVRVDYLAATLTAPAETEDYHFYLDCPKYIETAEFDSIYNQEAKIFVSPKEFYLIRGKDTTSRKICHYGANYSELRMSCGDYIKPVRRAADGSVYALWYREGKHLFYFSELW